MSINPYAFREIGGSPLDVQSSPSFGQTLDATLGYTYDPIFEAIGNQFKYMNTFDASYDAMSDMEGYEDYATDLVGAKNSNHMLDMKRAIDESKERREDGNEEYGCEYYDEEDEVQEVDKDIM